MKKIILILIVFLNACLVQAQQGQSFGSTSKVLSVEEANKLNGTPQTTINGKPYSQYKAEQDQLRQQQSAVATQRQVVKPQTGVSNPPVSQEMQPAKTTTDPTRAIAIPEKNTAAVNQTLTIPAVEQKQPNKVIQPAANSTVYPGTVGTIAAQSVQNTKQESLTIDPNSSIAPVKPSTKVASRPVSENAVNSTNSGMTIAPSQKVENLNNKVGSLGDIVPAKPVVIEPAKSQIVEAGNKVNTPASVSTMNGAPGQAGANLTANPTPVQTTSLKTPDVKIDNSGTIKMEEVPASVTNPAVKKPVAQMQSNEKVKSKD